jgi:hypothetical protein
LSLSKESKQRIRVHTFFEPNPVNHLRHCESLKLNDWHHPQQGEEIMAANAAQKASIVIHPIGVSQQNGELSFKIVSANPGTGHFETTSSAGSRKNKKSWSLHLKILLADMVGWMMLLLLLLLLPQGELHRPTLPFSRLTWKPCNPRIFWEPKS